MTKTAYMTKTLPALLRSPLCRRCTSATGPYPFKSYGADAELSATPNEPSAKQVTYAKALALQTGTEMPDKACLDKQACSAFIREQLLQLPPTDFQIDFVSSLARRRGIEPPDEAIASRAGASAFIDRNTHAKTGPTRSTGMSEPPSREELLFSASLARQQGLGLDAKILRDRQACLGFIQTQIGQLLGQLRTDPDYGDRGPDYYGGPDWPSQM
mmetsp:Transcript_209/g.477  ORF Transcript_209/g.477 Transcript_209/m.477 type:complete len:214 (-) Transcript_209:247-888(-)